MDEILASLQAFIASPSGLALKALLAGALITFVLGVMAALRDGTFKLDYIDSFVRSSIWGKVAPVAALLVAGYYLDASGVITATAVVSAGVVATGMIKAALDSIVQMTQPKEVSAASNTPPGS